MPVTRRGEAGGEEKRNGDETRAPKTPRIFNFFFFKAESKNFLSSKKIQGKKSLRDGLRGCWQGLAVRTSYLRGGGTAGRSPSCGTPPAAPPSPPLPSPARPGLAHRPRPCAVLSAER